MNGWTPTPRNAERIEYDSIEKQRTLAKFWVLLHNQMHPITDIDSNRLNAALWMASKLDEPQREPAQAAEPEAWQTEATAEHAEWLDWQRTQEDAR
jgi:hypothetical protein